MTTVHETAVKRFIHDARDILVLHHFVFMSALYGFLWGTAVLILRLTTNVPNNLLLWGLTGLLPVAILAFLLALRRLPKHQDVRALLDGSSHAGGLLMASQDVELGAWTPSVVRPRMPQLNWKGHRRVGLLLLSGIFVVLAFLVPKGLSEAITPHRLEVDREVAQLTDEIVLLEEEKILNEEQAEKFRETLEEVKKEAAGRDPSKTWEALDHLNDILEKAAGEAAEDAIEEGQKMADIETLAGAVLQDLAELSPEQRAAAMKELADMAEKAAKECAALGTQVPKELAEAIEKDSLSPEQLRELSKCLQGCQNGLGSQLSKLADAGLIDPEMLQRYEGSTTLGNCKPGDLSTYLNEHGEDVASGDLLGTFGKELPGRGGVTRGRGDAPMTWTAGTSPEDAKFKKEVLPPANVADLKKSIMTGVSTGTPTEHETELSSGGGLEGTRAGGGSGRTRVILPRHRGAVKRYFDRTPAPKPVSETKGTQTP